MLTAYCIGFQLREMNEWCVFVRSAIHLISCVLDLVSQIRDVVLVRCIFNSRNPRGSGFWNGEGMGRGWKWGDQFTSNLGPRWTGSYHSKEGSK